MTGQHDLDNSDEKKRVLEAGGRCVSNGEVSPARVNARLNMTRSIGDLDLKSYGVIATPTSTVYKVCMTYMCNCLLSVGNKTKYN